ncbi:MAG: hypothetical protein KIS88_07815 [Anaerolineales bacterium]|nr:hypothetical protein [Anaerolineales bacterium]
MSAQRERAQDVKKLAEYIVREIPLVHDMTSSEFGYDNPALICMDAVLSMNRKYAGFVKPRIDNFRTEYPSIDTLDALRRLIQLKGHEGFCQVWNYRHVARVELLERLSTKFLTIAEQEGQISDLVAMRDWAAKVDVMDHLNFNVKGIGLATFQYLRMLLGVATVKPDVHISRAVALALGEGRSLVEAISLLEHASKQMGLDATYVDHNIWKHFSQKA